MRKPGDQGVNWSVNTLARSFTWEAPDQTTVKRRFSDRGCQAPKWQNSLLPECDNEHKVGNN
jgi:hypothetical protein